MLWLSAAVVGGIGVKKIMDCFIEDDNVKMFGTS